jgi:hypothetical protein
MLQPWLASSEKGRRLTYLGPGRRVIDEINYFGG